MGNGRIGSIRNLKGKYVGTSSQVKSGKGLVVTLTVNATANAGYAQLRDGGAAGTVIYRVDTPATAGQSSSVHFGEAEGLGFETNIYLELSNATASVAYE